MLAALTGCSSADVGVVVSTPTPLPTASPAGSTASTAQSGGSTGVRAATVTPTAIAVRSASGAAAPAATIELRPPQVGVGEAMRVRARVSGAATASVRFRGIDYQMLPQPDGWFWAVVGAPRRDYLWVLSRAPVMAEADYAAAVAIARREGFAVEKLQRTVQP